MDVLDAQRGLLDAQIGLNNAVLSELKTIVKLYKALGGGYTNEILQLEKEKLESDKKAEK